MADKFKNAIQDDVDDITASILAIQAADMAEKSEPECIDIVRNSRGAAAGCDHTLLEIAEAVELGDTAFPAQNVKKLLNKAVKSFAKNFYLASIIRVAAAQGFNVDDAISLAEKSWEIEKESVKTDSEILREIIDVNEEPEANFRRDLDYKKWGALPINP